MEREKEAKRSGHEEIEMAKDSYIPLLTLQLIQTLPILLQRESVCLPFCLCLSVHPFAIFL